jgi:beta-1,4-N-acetylglucosaminyltransferase
LLLSNGPGTCVPIIFAACFVQIFSIAFKRIFCVFVESFCRVKTISLSGKIVYSLVDKFILQWPPTDHLSRKYPHAVYRGRVL